MLTADITKASTQPEMGPLLYGVRSIAQFLGIKPRQAMHLIEQDRLPHFRVGRVLCTTRATLSDWLASQQRQSSTN
jgi:hypothetical protein